MPNHHFLSYSPADAQEFAFGLHDALEAGPPPVPMWLDKRDLKPGQPWDAQLAEAIRSCDSLLFVLSRDSVEDPSVCKDEWTLALKYKKPIVPLLLHGDAETPFRLGNLQHLDFTGAFDPALARLRIHLEWLKSPAGVLQAMKDRLAIANRDLRRAVDEAQQTRIRDDIAPLATQIADQERIVADPQGAARRVEESIARGLERERQPVKPVGSVARSKFINPPPGLAPSYFQDRHVETKLIGDALKDETKRLIMVVGRGGIGKTALVCRLLKSLESGQLPDDGGLLEVDGIVYLNALGSRRVNAPNLFADLGKLLPEETARALDALARDPIVSTVAKMQALLEAFPRGRVVLLLDNFEDIIDPETLAIRDTELDEALRALLKLPHHAVEVILTTRIAPRELALVQPSRQTRIDLDEGLPSPYAENILREMDASGKVGLKSAPEALLAEVRERTRGYPRALEALFAILSADRDSSLDEVLNNTASLLPENVVEALVGEAFSRLDPTAQQVMQALAVYSLPVPPAAVDYLIQPYRPSVNSAPVLGRLVNMQFTRKEAGRYYLHPVDRFYALGRVAPGMPSDRDDLEKAKFTQFALLHRAADYFKQARLPREDWKTLEDIGPHLAEFGLRYEGHDFDTAAAVLSEFDHHLSRWGHARLVAELHEQLQGKIISTSLQWKNLSRLGLAYFEIGRVRIAISFTERALACAREARDRNGEGSCLSILGDCYSKLGQKARAIECYEQDLAIAREIRDRRRESIDLGDLGRCYGDLGQAICAIEHLVQALAIARQIDERPSEGFLLACLAETLIDEGRFNEALPLVMEMIRIGEEIGDPRLGSRGGRCLSMARLYTGDFSGARDAAEAASRYFAPWNNHNVLALLGLSALRQGDRIAAHEALTAAIAQADTMLNHEPCNFDALDGKGLALSGLAVCEGGHRVPGAIAAYRAARAINRDAGVVGRVLRSIDALAVADSAVVLVGVREAAAGS